MFTPCSPDQRQGIRRHERALSVHPNSAQVLSSLGLAHVQSPIGDHEPAVGYYERAMRLSPLDPEIGSTLIGIAMAHNQAKRFERALPFAQRGVERAPNNPYAYRTLIYALTGLGRPEEARAAGARLLVVRPDWRASMGWPPGRDMSTYVKAVIQALVTTGIPE
jgi:adenylate cyclase